MAFENSCTDCDAWVAFGVPVALIAIVPSMKAIALRP